MSYTGLLPTGGVPSLRQKARASLGAVPAANFVPNTPKEVSPKFAAYYNDWATPLSKAGLDPTSAAIAMTTILQTPSNVDPNMMQFIVNAMAIRGALKKNGYPVEMVGTPFAKGGIEDQVLTRQFNANWANEMVWGALLLGALAAPTYTGPNNLGTAALNSVPLLIGAGVLALLFLKGK